MSHEPRLIQKSRLDALVDGVFAVAMTLLVIDIKLPEQSGPGAYFQGKARISVVVASDPVWYGPSEDAEDNGGQILGTGRPRAQAANRWTGMVRSAPMEVTLTKPGEGAGEKDE